MRAYHGTDAEHIDSIRREGLRAPASLSIQREGAALYARMRAAQSWVRGGDGLGAIVEVEVEEQEIEPEASILFPGAQRVARRGVAPERLRGVELSRGAGAGVQA